MAVPPAPIIDAHWGSKVKGDTQSVMVKTTTGTVSSVTCIVSQTEGGTALWSRTLSSPQDTHHGDDYWTFGYPTDSITSSPYYVRAYGTNSDGSGPYVERSFQLLIPPTVAVTSPANGATLTSSAVTMAWTATDQTGISYQRASVSKDGAELWAVELDGNARSATVPQSVVFSSGESYAFSVTARNGRGMESTATSTASFYFATPTSAVLGIAEGAGKSAVIEVTGYTPRESSSQPDPDYVDVARVNPDGSLWMVATGLHVGDTVTDPLPPLGSEAVYKAIGRVVNAGVSEAAYTITIATSAWALNYGDGASEGIELRYNPQASYTMSHGGDLYHFADGGTGNGLPVFYSTTDRDESGTLKFDTILNDDADALRHAVMAHPVMWLRDPFGHRWRAHVKLSYTHGVGQLWPVTLAWDAVRFEEA